MPNKGIFSSEEIQAFVSRPLYDSNILSSKDTSYPKISIVIPSYNQAPFLERTILSILNQNYPNTEIIIMDGGSEDGSVEVIKKCEPYISYWVSEPDKGQSNAINKGFKKATGDLIGWQNSDDIYLPGFFHTVAWSFNKYPRLQLFIGNIYIIDEYDRIIGESKFIPFSLNHLIYYEWNLSSQAVFINRQTVEEVGPLREDIQVGFDWDWFIRVGKIVKYHILHKSYGGCYRIHSASKLSVHVPESRWQMEAQILRSHGVKVREERPYRKQLWWQTPLLRLRWMIFIILLYYPKTILSRLRPIIVSSLARLNIICEGFE